MDNELSLLDHLRELRDRLTRIALAIALGFAIAYAYRLELFELLTRPVWSVLHSHGIRQLQVLDVTEAIVMYMKTSFIGGLVLSSPYTLHQVWRFIAPGLYAKERRSALAILVPSVLFLLLGLAFAYAVMIPFAIDFLVGYALENPALAVELTVQSTLGFELTFLMIFAVVFELPLVMTFLVALGVGSFAFFAKQWRVAIVVAFVIGAVLTPPDVVSQTLLAGPLCALYGLGLLGAWVVERRKAGRAVSLASFARVGVVLAAVLVPLWLYGVQPLVFPPPTVPAQALLWQDLPVRAITAVRYADGALQVQDLAPAPDDLVPPEGHDASAALAALEPLVCPGLCWWESDPRRVLEAFVPSLAGMAEHVHGARLACASTGGITLEFGLHAPEPWTRFALERLLADDLARGRSAAWGRASRPEVRVSRNSVQVEGPLPYTRCRSQLHKLFEEHRP